MFFKKKSPQLPVKQKIFAEEILVLKNKINGKMRKRDAILRKIRASVLRKA